MSIETALRAQLAASPVAALVVGRIYPLRLPQLGTLPALTYQRISTVRARSQTGPSGLATVVFQIDCWAHTFDECRVLAAAVRQALDGFRGQLGGLVPCGSASIESELDLYEPEADLYRTTLQVEVWHEE